MNEDASTENTSSTASVVRTAQIAATALVCSLVSAVALYYTGDYIFLLYPMFLDVYKSVKVTINPGHELMYSYGMAAWGVLLIATVVSFDRAIRDPLGRRTLALTISVAVAALLFAALVHQAAWGPFHSLLQGVGTPS